ncbi:MAG: NAD(P)-dependent oxidoreductase [Chloroflexi bacterium]|nr:NAD(P)-dependent oxidoreductase [Chloroflexota bacterium]MCI0575539.1 NAD(P)-dependent oxidoreductase [Chloroflexota bacterium]MCI0644316.1 NAD(P)-dependent oxidoreductase [Chloroflexota bacterium]MCI0726299.1 NAD(P)-dependent oxidoreductase [Chloroflexota bacterium]
MSKVAVTGGSGFLGSHVAAALTDQGYEVVIFDRRPSSYLLPGQKMVVGDIREPAAVEEALAGCEVVYHLAALADLNTARTRPVDTVHLNIAGTVNCLEAARKTNVRRFMFASTIYVYSRAGGFYRCSKQAGEAYIEEYHRQFGLEYTILRYGSLYGPHADESNGVYRLLLQAATTGRIRHTGSPDESREYIHVEDAARLSVTALDEGYANRHLVLTGHYPMRLRDLFTMFSEILGRPVDVEYTPPPEGEPDGHYKVTPYAFNPRVGRKLTASYYVDMGQGLLQMLEQLYEEGRVSVDMELTS